MAQFDLDQGGRFPQVVKTNLGPTVGWKMTDSPVDIEWVFDGGTGVILPGTRATVISPDWLYIDNWVLLSPVAGSVTIDVYKITLDAYLAGAIPGPANSICGTALPVLTNQTAAGSSALTGWNTLISQNDVLAVNISGVANLLNLNFTLRCQRSIGPS